MFRKSIFAIQRDLILGVISVTSVMIFVLLVALVFSLILAWWYS